MKISLFIFLLSFVFSISKNEKLVYNAKFRNIPAGTAIMEIKHYLEDSTKYEIVYSLQTKKFIDVFYKLREHTLMLTDIKDFTLQYINKQSRQGKYKKKHQATFEYNNNIVIYNNQEYVIDDKVYDPIGVIYYLRYQKLGEEQKYYFDVYSSGKIKQIEMRYAGEDIVILGKKEYECFIYELYSQDKESVLKNKGELKVWFSKDNGQIPLIIEKKAKYGSIVLRYNNHYLN